MAEKRISPSLICMDLCNLEQELRCLERLGCRMVHLDIIDGRFSPDMPLGIGTVRQLRALTDLIFDVHLMATENAPYVDLLLDSGADRICFHTEFEPRPTVLLRKIRAAGKQAGIAVSPETPLESVRYLLPLCDFVLFLCIDAGYAHLPGQEIYPQTAEKLRDARAYLRRTGRDLELAVDGRVDFSAMRTLCAAGADTFVSGSRGLFRPGASREENWRLLQEILNEAEG